jgi:hypothetical protein
MLSAAYYKVTAHNNGVEIVTCLYGDSYVTSNIYHFNYSTITLHAVL